MNRIATEPELIASAAQDQPRWGLYTREGELFEKEPPTWQDLSLAEQILIKRGDWRARKRLLAYTSRRLRQERRIAESVASLLENTLRSAPLRPFEAVDHTSNVG